MIKGVKSKKQKKNCPTRPAFLFAELFATIEAFATFASLHSYSYSIFSLLKRNKLIEPKIKLNLQLCSFANLQSCKAANLQICKRCKRFKLDLNKNTDREYFNLKILDLHNVG